MWGGPLKKRRNEHHIAGGAANEYDHNELSGFSDFAKRSQADALGFRGTLFRSTRVSS
jgi:hypothetical protein